VQGKLTQGDVDAQNADFWNELCGSHLARVAGVEDASPESLKKFDDTYLALYPYLREYVLSEGLDKKRVLEIGLGYGVLGQLLVASGCDYYGLDIASNPVTMMRHRLALLGHEDADRRIQQGSALAIPHQNECFDYVFSIGCLHHTGDLKKAVSEVHRTLVPGGKALVMLYHRHSLRQLLSVSWRARLKALVSGWLGGEERARFETRLRALYDTNQAGVPAPHTDYVSHSEVRKLFKDFNQVRIDRQNCDPIVWFGGRLVISRERLLPTLGRALGLDLYIWATK
jgi:SAM-dependent methyltransferase